MLSPQIHKKIGLYIHIPFCSQICHYCDFAKTARWQEESVKSYFAGLENHLQFWCSHYLKKNLYKFPLFFFGGGTPGLFDKEYEKIFLLIRPYLTDTCEVTLELNPNNISTDSLSIWKNIGINRLSIGVQSFSESGLKFLKRDHSSMEAYRNIELAKKYFGNINIDLIYAWPGQKAESWDRDLNLVTDLDVQHLSLYDLHYAAGTPIGRAKERGKIKALPELENENRYERACEVLAASSFVHEEVANWSKAKYSCKHNWLYWQDSYFIGLGLGAWGYLPLENNPIGLRYSYTRKEKDFLNSKINFTTVDNSGIDLESILTCITIENRSKKILVTRVLRFFSSFF